MKRRWSASALALGLGCTVTGCAATGCAGLDVHGTLGDGVDGSVSVGDDASEAPAPADDATDACTAGDDASACACPTGTHACATGCSQPYPNDPDAGCALGCGTPCPVPGNGKALCTAAGTCDFTCDEGFYSVDGGAAPACACPGALKACGGTCNACCAPSDCPPHVLCGPGGVCAGCEPNWADCNKNPADGCEADLSQDGNCGACGNSCCGWPCCGPFSGGMSCRQNGSAFSCQC